ncbi:hypothetical protein [Sphingobacterium cellulitidis]|uniref:Uncharacterized protein n=1 Tax=Sphingobacterium cellulitidis TaxID=1768011 RepID=A0A8H9FY12_9SPHI|nr:hypothetical protein [Sphingobacterium soli]GGE15699.1 hypothetical protein GCM10011516_11830 [Sphingobacterium soli]
MSVLLPGTSVKAARSAPTAKAIAMAPSMKKKIKKLGTNITKMFRRASRLDSVFKNDAILENTAATNIL